jgi:hypothetical protein
LNKISSVQIIANERRLILFVETIRSGEETVTSIAKAALPAQRPDRRFTAQSIQHEADL